MTRRAAWWALLFLAAFLFTQTARADLVASLHDGRLRVINEKGALVYSTRNVLSVKEGHTLVGFVRKEKQGGPSFNLIGVAGKVVYRSRDVEEYFIDDAIAAVIEGSGKLKVLGPEGSVCFTESDGADRVTLSDDFLAFMQGDRLNVVTNRGKRTLSIKGVTRFRLTRNLVVFREDGDRVIATREGKVVNRERAAGR